MPDLTEKMAELRGLDELRMTWQLTCKDGFSKLWTVDKPAVDDYKTKKYGMLIGKCIDRLALYETTVPALLEALAEYQKHGTPDGFGAALESSLANHNRAREAEREIAEAKERARAAEGMQPLTKTQLQKMDDQRVVVKYPGLEMAALVSYQSEESDFYDEEDGTEVWLTNNKGGRDALEKVIAAGGTIYGRGPQQEGAEQ